MVKRKRKFQNVMTATLIVLTAVLGFFLLRTGPTHALSGSDFKAGRIIDDFNFRSNLTSVAQIQILLNNMLPSCDSSGQKTVFDATYGDTVTRATYGARRGNPVPFTCLKDYYENTDNKANNYGGQPIPVGAKSAAQIIWEAGNAYNINPQVLVVTLQKEQGLLTDDWPFKNQFLYAMGAHCPDSGPGNSANCDPAYAGFSTQMQEAAKLYKYYIDNMSQAWWPYAKPGNRDVRFSPNAACSSSNVFIENQATAALYTYTPYQPNQAALNNLYGTGDACSSYGNRNFWRMYNDWFGPSIGEGYVFATSYNDNGDPRQWVIYQGVRRLLPDPVTVQAWGLDKVTLLQWTGDYLGSIPEGPALTRLMRPSGSLDVYFVDSGRAYKLPSAPTLGAWGLDPAAISDVSLGLSTVPLNSGLLSYAVRDAANPTGAVYMVDGGTKRHYSDPNVLAAWEGDSPTIINLSSNYINSMPSGSDLTCAKISDGSQNYQVVAGQKLTSSSEVSALYPGLAQTVNTATLKRLVDSVPASQFVKSGNSATIYMVDSSTKHPVATPQVLRAWGKGANPPVNIVTQGNLNLLSDGSTLNTYQADVGGQLYLMDGRKITVSTGLDSAYRDTGNVYSASSSLIALLPDGGSASDFIKGFNTPSIYLVDAKSLRHIKSAAEFSLWDGNKPVTTVSEYVLSQLNTGSDIGAYITDGTSEYMMENGLKHLVSPTTKNNWHLSSPSTLAGTTIARIISGSDLANKFQYAGQYFFVQKGFGYTTVDANIAAMWGINDSANMNPALLSLYLTPRMLTTVANSTISGDSRLFTIDRGVLYWLTPTQAANLGVGGLSTPIDPGSMTVQNWSSYVVRDEGGSNYVLDAGKKRPLPAGVIRDQWIRGNQSSVPAMTNGFLNNLPNGVPMERAIKGSGQNIYAADNFTKRWIQNPDTYKNNYAPLTQVSDFLLNLMPEGTLIN
jgi:hypothetical protein